MSASGVQVLARAVAKTMAIYPPWSYLIALVFVVALVLLGYVLAASGNHRHLEVDELLALARQYADAGRRVKLDLQFRELEVDPSDN